MNAPLSHAFLEADPAPHRIGDALLVGARPDEVSGIGLSNGDEIILGFSTDLLKRWKVPIFDEPNLRKTKKLPDNIRIINMLDIYGGEDFLETEKKGRLVALCNIRRDVRSHDKGRENAAFYRSYEAGFACFASSEHHDDLPRWHTQFDRVGADFVLIHGCDNFSPQELNNGAFVQIGMDHVNLLIRRAYLEAAEEFLCIQGSPLFGVWQQARKNPNLTFYEANWGRDSKIVPDTAPAYRAFA